MRPTLLLSSLATATFFGLAALLVNCGSDDSPGDDWLPKGGGAGTAGSVADGSTADVRTDGKAGSGGTAGKGGSAGSTGNGGTGGSSGGGGTATGGTGGTSNLPTCDCYYKNGTYCGEGVVKEAAQRGCKVDLVPEHQDDILRCTDGTWTVDKECSEGCVVADVGKPDFCKTTTSPNSYYLPWTCGDSHACTQGNNGSFSHSGNQKYAWDFDMDPDTPILASRGGTVVFSDNKLSPGDTCYNGCSDTACCESCKNLANRVVVDHGDGTNALYLHLNKATATQGSTVSTGDLLGYSGATGCAFGAHLHFQVQTDCGIWFCTSVEMSFADAPGLKYQDVPTSQNACQ